MANISDAIGSLSLEGDWTEIQKNWLMYLLISQEDSNYSTCFPDGFDGTFKNLQECNSTGFCGNGRWAYTCNLEALHNWSVVPEERWNIIMESVGTADQIPYDTYLQIRQELFKEMFEHDLKIAWEFADTDPGLDWMCTCEGLHIVTFNSKNYTLTYLEQHVEYYACNFKNYCNLYNYDDDLLYECVSEALNIYSQELKLEGDCPIIEEDIVNMIKQHPTWYDIAVFPYFAAKDDIPVKLREALENYFKEKDLYDNSK